MVKIWEKYLIKQFFGTLILVLFGFYSLFILLDFSTHASHFPHTMESRWTNVTIFYYSEFFNRVDVLLPFSILIATIKTLCQLNVNNEIVAMMAGGVMLKRLLRPLVVLGFIFVALSYFNAQFTLPISLNKLKNFSEERKRYKKKKNDLVFVQHLALADNSTLIFQNFDHLNQRFFDAYWIRSTDDIYRIKYLYPNEKNPRGLNVEHLQGTLTGKLYSSGLSEETTFPNMVFNKNRLLETTTIPEELSLTSLWKRLPCLSNCHSEKESNLIATFYYKITMPWLCLLAIIGPAPFCLRFSRNLPVFFLYACFTFALVTLYLVMGSLEILGKRQVIDPLWILIGPLIGFGIPAMWYYRKLR